MRFLFLLMLIFPSSRCNGGWNMLFDWPRTIEKCESKCLTLFNDEETGQKQMWPRSSSCQQGCRFYSLTQVMDFFGSLDKEISNSCHDSCHEANILLNFRRACDRGCQEMKRLLSETEPEKKEQDFADLFDLRGRIQTVFTVFGFADGEKTNWVSDDTRSVDLDPEGVFSETGFAGPQEIAHVWIRTMPISNRLMEQRQVPSEIDGDFQMEEVTSEAIPWTFVSCLSGRSGIPDWALLFLLAGAFIYLSYLGGQFFSNAGNRGEQVPEVVYLPPYKSVRRLSYEDFAKLRPDELESNPVKKPPISTI